MIPQSSTWARDTRWKQGYAGAFVPNEPAGPDPIVDLDLFVTTGDPRTAALLWTAVGDASDSATADHIELAHVFEPDTLFASNKITKQNFNFFKRWKVSHWIDQSCRILN